MGIYIKLRRYIYILATIFLCLLGIGQIQALATGIYANGGHFSDGSTSTYVNVVEGARGYTAKWEAPTRDGAEFMGYMYKTVISGDNPDLWDAIYNWKHGGDRKVVEWYAYYGGSSSEYYYANKHGYYEGRYKYSFDSSTGIITGLGHGTRTCDNNGNWGAWHDSYSTASYSLNNTRHLIPWWESLYETPYESGNYYAVWAKRKGFNISFNVNGGSVSISNQVAANVTLPSPGTKTGYTFDGWYNGNTRIGGIGDKWTPTANATITAHWMPITYTITYELNGGKLDYKKVKYNIETPTFYIENPKKKGCNFLGWTGTGIETATTDLSVALGSYGDKTFEANWGNGVYAISFDGNGATSGEMETITVNAGENVELPENGFERDGYSFVGWYTTKEDRFGTFYRDGATIENLTESVTLHAQWKKEKTPTTPGDNGNNGTGGNGSDTGDGNGTGGGTGSDTGNGSGNGGSGTGIGDNGGNTSSGEGGNGSGNGGNGSTGDSGNGDKPSTGDNTGSGSTGDNGNNGTGGSDDNGGSGSGRSNDDGRNVPVMTPEDEIGYFGTGMRKNEITICTTLGINDKKLTLNYNY